MWFLYAILAQVSVVTRRTSEKHLASLVDHRMMAWLQQFISLPFVILLLPFADFYNPFGLSQSFYLIIAFYTIFIVFDLLLYFKALSVGDISVIAPLLSLAAASSLVGSFFILDQRPTSTGILAMILIFLGVYLCSSKRKKSLTATNNTLAVLCVLSLVLIRGVTSPIEVLPIRETNPIYFNFITSLTTVPAIMLIVFFINRYKKTKMEKLKTVYYRHRLALLLIGATHSINMTFSYYAKVMTPNAAYVTSIKTASVLPMVIIGAVYFKEHVSPRQWQGIGIILLGLLTFAFA